MNGVENLLPERLRYERPRRAVAAVDDQLMAAEIDASEVQAGSGVISDPPEVRIQRLLGCYGIPIDAEIRYGVDNAREVVLSGLGACGCAGVDRRGDW